MDENSDASDHSEYTEIEESASTTSENEIKQAQQQLAQNRRRKPPSSRDRGRLFKHANERYCDLLNEYIEQTHKHKDDELDTIPLSASQVGSSCWTSSEKEKFFRLIRSYGPSSIRNIANTIGTKSCVEVQQFEEALRFAALDHEMNIGVGESNSGNRPPQTLFGTTTSLDVQDRSQAEAKLSKAAGSSRTDVIKGEGADGPGTALVTERFTLSDTPAACELPPWLVDHLEHAADSLASLLDADQCESERTNFGESWLVDAIHAAQIDKVLDEENAKAVKDAEPVSTEGDTAHVHLDAAMRFFNVTEMLRLSRFVFMNSADPSQLNWQYIGEKTCVSPEIDEPAIYLSALHEFHRLVTIVTRRLVDITLFTATSRLRAGGSHAVHKRQEVSHMSAAEAKTKNAAIDVTKEDVKIAVKLLDMDMDSHKFWATVTKRHKIGLFINSSRHKGTLTPDSSTAPDGSQQNSRLRILTSAEIDHELGNRDNASGFPVQNLADQFDAFYGGDLHDIIYDEDLWEDHHLDPIDPSKDGDITEPEVNVTDESHLQSLASPLPNMNRRERSLSPKSYAEAEDHYLERLDKQSSAEEQSRLFKLLRIELAPDVDYDDHSAAARPQLKRSRDEEIDQQSHWRDAPSLIAGNAYSEGQPDELAFERMRAHGAANKQRRLRLYAEAQRRMDAGYESGDDIGVE